MADIIKNYLSYEGLSLYDELIKQYIATADEAVLNQILGEIKDGDVQTIAALNELVRTVTGTAGSALQEITKGTDGTFVTTTVTPKGEDKTQSIGVSVTTAAISETEKDGLVTASDARTALDKKVDKVDGSRLMTDAEGTKLAAIEDGAQVNVIETVKVNGTALTPDADKAVDVVVPVLDVDTTAVDGLKLTLTDKVVGLADNGLAATLEGKNVTVRKKADTEDNEFIYEILQGETVVGTINHPADMVVTSGELVEIDGEQYLRLTIANQTEPVDIPVKNLVDVYTAGAGIAISDANEVSINFAADQGNVVFDTTNGLKASVDLSGKQDVMEAITTAEIENLFADTTSL